VAKEFRKSPFWVHNPNQTKQQTKTKLWLVSTTTSLKPSATLRSAETTNKIAAAPNGGDSVLRAETKLELFGST
jgi:hypothetical protein